MDIFLSVVIPCYNEEINLKKGVLEKVDNYLKKQQYSWEVIVVDDGSTDGSKQIIKNFIKDKASFQLLERSHQGKANTVIGGVQEAKGSWVLFADLDQATPIKEIEKFLINIDKGEVMIGSRAGEREGAPLSRKIMAWGFILLRRIFLGLGDLKDTQCGFKLFKHEAAREIFSRLRLYGNKKQVQGSAVTAGFDVEILFLAKKLGYQTREIPVEWHYMETRRVNPIKDSLQALKDIFILRLNDLRGSYEI